MCSIYSGKLSSFLLFFSSTYTAYVACMTNGCNVIDSGKLESEDKRVCSARPLDEAVFILLVLRCSYIKNMHVINHWMQPYMG